MKANSIHYKQTDSSCLSVYQNIPMKITIRSILSPQKIDRGLGGILLQEIPVPPQTKDFCLAENALDWQERFDLTNWAFFMAFDNSSPIGAAAVASRTPGIHMLDGRDDLAVLWDIRVDEAYRGRGVGHTLFQMVTDWARKQGFLQLKIECQNNNVNACRFYHRQGAVLCQWNEYAYYTEEAYRNEIQFLWYVDL